MNLIDALIILALLYGAVLGWKRGLISSAVTFIGTIIVILLAFWLKNPISTILYTFLPFWNFGGVFQDATIMNILLYEALAFLIVFFLLSAALRIIIRMSGIVDKLIKATVILALPSKIIGALLGIFQFFIFAFVALFVLKQFQPTYEIIAESRMGIGILQRTPILSNIIAPALDSIAQIHALSEYHPSGGTAYNLAALDVLLNNNIISTNSATRLVEREKLPSEAMRIIERHE